LRRLHNEELNDLYSSPNIYYSCDRINQWEGQVAGMGEIRGFCRVLIGKPEGKREFGRPRLRQEDNIKVVLKAVCWGYGLDRSGSGEGQVAVSCECGNGPSGSRKCGTYLD